MATVSDDLESDLHVQQDLAGNLLLPHDHRSDIPPAVTISSVSAI
jgi:hypothetical protein